MIRTAGRAIAAGFATAITAFAAGLVLLIYLLSQGPISLNYFTPYLKKSLESIDNKINFDVQDTVLSWQGWDRKLDLRFVGVEISDTNGYELADIPEMSMAINPIAFMKGQISLQSLEMFGPSIRLSRGSDGSFRVGIGLEDEEETSAETSESLMSLFSGFYDGGEQRDNLSGLTEITVRDADIQFNDVQLGIDVRAPSATFNLRRVEQGASFKFLSWVEADSIGALIEADLVYRGRQADIPVNVEFSGLNIEKLLALTKVVDPEILSVTDLNAFGNLSTMLAGDGSSRPIQFNIGTGSGDVTVAVAAKKPYKIQALKVVGAVTSSFESITLGSAELKLPDGRSVDAKGRIDLNREYELISLDLNGAFQNVETADVAKYWPDQVAPDARIWVAEHLSKGKVEKATWALELDDKTISSGKFDKDFFKIDFDFQGVHVDYLPPMPTLENASGSASLRYDSLVVKIDKASYRDLKASRGRLSIASFSQKTPTLNISFQAEGSIASGLSVLNTQPLQLGQYFSLTPDNVDGQMRTNATLKVPLADNIDASNVDFEVVSKFSKTSAKGLAGLLDVADADIELKVDRKAVIASGEGAFNQIPARFDIEHVFPVKDRLSKDKIVASTVLSEKAQKAFGLDLAPRLVGPIKLKLEATRVGEADYKVQANADLQATTLYLPMLEWRKEKGAPGSANFNTVLDDSGTIKIEDLKIRAENFDVDGRMEFDANNNLKRFQATKLKIDTQDLTADVNMSKAGGLDIRLGGEVLDLRSIIDELEEEGEEGVALPNIRFTSNIKRVLVTKQLTVGDAILSVLWDASHLVTVKAWGKVNGGPPVRADLVTKGKTRHLRITSRAGGEVLTAMDLFHNAYGGKLNLEASIPEKPSRENPIVGSYRLEDFVIARAETLGELLSHGELTEFLDELSGDGIKFTRMEIPFSYENERLVVDELRAVGPSFGATMRGVVDRNTEKLDLQGTIIPAYTLNSALGNIPIIGRLFTGGKVGGVFAVTFRIKGTIDDPITSTSTLSAFAPGFLRTIIESLDAPAIDDQDEKLLEDPTMEREWR
jgi:uncharacterized protein YhdP